jgi:hypothetical protein
VEKKTRQTGPASPQEPASERKTVHLCCKETLLQLSKYHNNEVAHPLFISDNQYRQKKPFSYLISSFPPEERFGSRGLKHI